MPSGYKPGFQRAELRSWDSVLLQAICSFLKPSIEFIFGVLASVAILLLEQADELIVLTANPFQVIVGQLAPPLFNLAPHFFPLAFIYIFVHDVILQDPTVKLPRFHRRCGQHRAPISKLPLRLESRS